MKYDLEKSCQIYTTDPLRTGLDSHNGGILIATSTNGLPILAS